MLSRALEGDIHHGYVEIQERVDSEHTQNESLCSEHLALAERTKELEAWVTKLEGERRDLREEVRILQGARVVLEAEIEAER